MADRRQSEAGFLQLLRQGPPSDVGDAAESDEATGVVDVESQVHT